MDKEEAPSGAPDEQHRGEQRGEASHPDDHVANPGVRYEPKDIYLGRILGVIVIALCVVGALYFGVWRFFRSQERVQEEFKKSPYPLAPAPSTALPPEPRLEELDRLTPEEMEQLDLITSLETAGVNGQLAAQEKALHEYGPSSEKDFVRIPIEQAMKALAGTLPVAKESSPGRDANGLVDAGQSNSGRMFRGPSP